MVHRIQYFHLFTLILLVSFMGCMPIIKESNQYDYFVDTTESKPYSSLFQSDSIAYTIQFPIRDPNESFLYDTDYVAYLFVGAKGHYSIRNLWATLVQDQKELIPYRSSYISDQTGTRRHTKIIPQSDPPREFDFDYRKQALIGFSFYPEQLNNIKSTEFVVSFDLIEGNKDVRIEKRFQLTRSKLLKEISHPIYGETNAADAFLWGPWWLGWGGGSESSKMQNEYNKLVAKAGSNKEAAYDLTGQGLLPCLRAGRFHFEGFFYHMDRN